ncbi:uncharacterized protein LOC9636025 [Selaginella moellendorffii]|uniref:uncharacterized protein LOC9636025 n=1 Tax=Selaginella moellendorffii TaxID=88036 RepID=UPI000D1CD196|nr:uncharacterized protein LOC9636025 [Selaginella moellendorffii]|eukprot:XP_024526629.1 uncharacterized protein LOC9636025 [Selaginella moellendorffii]
MPGWRAHCPGRFRGLRRGSFVSLAGAINPRATNALHFHRFCVRCVWTHNEGDWKPTRLKWRIVVSYDGTRFSGWQYQPDFPTVQGLIEDALTKLTRYTREELLMAAASRTDAGVHALGQVAHFHSPACIGDLSRIHRGLNGTLPHEIRVREISPAKSSFHAQACARTKRYQYKLFVAPVMDPLLRLYAYHVPERLDVAAMAEACGYFVGKHDFSTFSNSSTLRPLQNPVREILRFELLEQGPVLCFEIEGTGFFHKQIRNMVGLIVAIGKGEHQARVIPELLAMKDRQKLARVSITAPSRGLTLVSVHYDQSDLDLPENLLCRK